MTGRPVSGGGGRPKYGSGKSSRRKVLAKKGRKGLARIHYMHGVRAGRKRDRRNDCTSAEKAKIYKSIDDTRGILQKAYRRWPRDKFVKWFGRSNAHSDENVKLRYKFAMDTLYAKKDYSLVCCRSTNRAGRCTSCGGGTIAYVLVQAGSFNRYTQTDVKICPWGLKHNRGYGPAHLRLGFTMFHELMHLTSAATDHGYGKNQCLALAKRRPRTARLNAQAYMYYAMDAGRGGKYTGGRTPDPHSGGDDRRADDASRRAAEEQERRRKEKLARDRAREREARRRREAADKKERERLRKARCKNKPPTKRETWS